MQDLDETNVFVKYLPSDINDMTLRDLFSPFGEIVSTKVMVDPPSGASLGYGFVRFVSPMDAQKAIRKLSGHKLQNKFLMCKLSNSPPNIYSNGLSTNLYLKPLPPTTSQEKILKKLTDDIYQIFSKFGDIEAAKVMVDKATGKSMQIGFVRFGRQEDATAALNTMNGIFLDPEQPALIVKYAETDMQRLARKSRTNSNSNSNSNPASPTTSPLSSPVNSPRSHYYPPSPSSPPSTTYYYGSSMMIQYLPVSVPYNYYYSMSPPQGEPYVPVWGQSPYSAAEQTY